MHFCFRNSLVIKATYSNPDGQQVKKKLNHYYERLNGNLKRKRKTGMP